MPRIAAVRSIWRRKKSVIQSRKTFFSRSCFVNDGVLLVEVAERLRELERVARDMRRFARSRRRAPPPNRLSMRPAASARNLPNCELTGHALPASSSAAKSGSCLAALFQFAQDVASAHGRVLHVRAGLAFEAQRLLKIERDHGIARELQAGNSAAPRWRSAVATARSVRRQSSGWRDATSSSALAIRLVHQVVRLHAEAFAAGDFDVRALAILFGERMPSSAQQRGESATIS